MEKTEKKGFVNFSNHPFDKWSGKQIDEARKLAGGGELFYVPFTNVPPTIDESGLEKLADEALEKILEKDPSAVMCMGEFGLSYKVISELKKRGIKVVYSCSERVVNEKETENGIVKEVIFDFVRFREY